MKPSSKINIKTNIVQAIITLTAIISTFVVNGLSNIYPPSGLNIGEISNTVFKDVLIIPANYAFTIWGLIYIGLIAYGIYQLQPSQRQCSNIRRTNRYLVITCIVQTIWIYLFTMYWFWLSVAAILGILGSLILAYETLGVEQSSMTRRQRWLSKIPLSLYLGWISVATIVNIASALFSSGLQSYGTVWTVVMLVVGGGLVGLMIHLRADTVFTLVFIWAYVAIAVSQHRNSIILVTALGMAIAMVFYLICHQLYPAEGRGIRYTIRNGNHRPTKL